ncbi:MAG: Mur ligase family protein [Thermoleophilia bacterium]
MGSGPVLLGDAIHGVIRIHSDDDRLAATALLAESGVVMGIGPAASAAVLVVDEWTPQHDPEVLAARARGCRITTLADLILARAEGPIVAVTGTAGKTSTCHALRALLIASGATVAMSDTARSSNAWPDHSLADIPTPPHVVLIAELTSTHLCHMEMRRTVDVAIITTLRPDHADLHPNHAAYIESKKRILLGQGPSHAVVLPGDDPDTLSAIGPVAGDTWMFAGPDVGAKGAFRRADGRCVLRDSRGAVADGGLPDAPPVLIRAVLAAAAGALALGATPQSLAPHLAQVTSAPHRQRELGRFRNARVIDDTMAATPRKTRAAIEAFASQRPVVVIGGDQFAHDPAEVTEVLGRIRDLRLRVVAFGEAGEGLGADAHAISWAPTVMGALGAAATIAGDGGLVLVSPMFPMKPAERDRVAALPES